MYWFISHWNESHEGVQGYNCLNPDPLRPWISKSLVSRYKCGGPWSFRNMHSKNPTLQNWMCVKIYNIVQKSLQKEILLSSSSWVSNKQRCLSQLFVDQYASCTNSQIDFQHENFQHTYQPLYWITALLNTHFACRHLWHVTYESHHTHARVKSHTQHTDSCGGRHGQLWILFGSEAKLL